MNLEDMSPQENSHQVLLSPELTAFVVVDHQVAFESCFDAKAVKVAENGVAELVDAAGRIGIPIITSLVKTNMIGPELSTTLEPKLPQLTRLNRSAINPWDDPAFEHTVQIANRSCLLIAGLSAETSLSFTG